VFFNPETYNCSDCNEITKREWGCDEPVERVLYKIDGEEYHQCPRKLLDDSAYHWLRLFIHYLNGFLYFPGGIANQPNIYLQVMEFLLNEKRKREKEEIEKSEKKLKLRIK